MSLQKGTIPLNIIGSRLAVKQCYGEVSLQSLRRVIKHMMCPLWLGLGGLKIYAIDLMAQCICRECKFWGYLIPNLIYSFASEWILTAPLWGFGSNLNFPWTEAKWKKICLVSSAKIRWLWKRLAKLSLSAFPVQPHRHIACTPRRGWDLTKSQWLQLFSNPSL